MNLNNKLLYLLMYLRKPPWDTDVSPPELIQFINENHPGKALDLGCGTGTNAITLSKHRWETTGVDFIRKAIREAKRKAARENIQVKFIMDDVTKLNKLDNHFDLILDIGCFHNLSNKGKRNYILNLNRLLAPKGKFLIYAWIANNKLNSPGLSEQDINAFKSIMNLMDRKDGFDRDSRASTWLTFERKPTIG